MPGIRSVYATTRREPHSRMKYAPWGTLTAGKTEGNTMHAKRWTVLAFAVGILLAAGVPFSAVTLVQADPGRGHGCRGHVDCGPGCPHHGESPVCPGCGGERGCPKGAARAVPPCMQDNAAAVPGGMHRMMHGGGGPPPIRDVMGKSMEEMRSTVAQLRALEAKMEILKSKDDAAAFRAASLEHSKLLTDLQASRLKQMEEMMGGK